MAIRKRFSITALTVLLLVATMFSLSAFSLTAKADGDVYTVEQIEQLRSENSDIIRESGIDPDGCFDTICGSALEEGADLKTVSEKLKIIEDVLFVKLLTVELYRDDRLPELFEARSIQKVKKIRDAFYKEFYFTKKQASKSVEEFNKTAEELKQKFENAVNEINAVAEADKKEFDDYKATAAKAVYDKYVTLAGVADSGNGIVENVSTYKRNIKAIADEYAYTEDGGETVTPVGDLDAAYDVKNVKACRDNVDSAKETALNRLTDEPKNSIERVWALYLQSISDSSVKLTTKDKNDVVNFYNKADQSVQLKYSNEYTKLMQHFEDAQTVVDPVKVSSMTDSRRAVKITARYQDGTAAKVIPEKCTLYVYSNANGATKRNANNLIKEKNSGLSVAYCIFISVQNGVKEYEMPEYDSSWRRVSYEVEIDLARYYTEYVEQRGYEKDKSSNIVAGEYVANNAGVALVYTYKSGEIAEVSDCKITEDGKLVFTVAEFKNFCIAGSGLDSFFANPLIYFIAFFAIILLIIILSIVLKHVKYTIKFETNGGTAVKKIKVSKNEAIVMPDAPEKQGFVFGGWYLDETFVKRFIDTRLRRRKGFTLYAKWSLPVSAEQLSAHYDEIRNFMVAYEKQSFKPTLGVKEKEELLYMFGEETELNLYLAIAFDKATQTAGNAVSYLSEDEKFAGLPTKVTVNDELGFKLAKKLCLQVVTDKNLQLKEVAPEAVKSTEEERKTGFTYFITNERVAASASDFVELLRMELKAYVLEKDNGKFKSGDEFTFARVYRSGESVDLFMPAVDGLDGFDSPEQSPRFEDAPVRIAISNAQEYENACVMIERFMNHFGFVKHPENCKDLADVDLPETNGFAYTLRF